MTFNSNKTFLYTISDDYIDKLKKKDYRVQNNYDGQRVYFKANIDSNLKDENLDYYIPLSSAKKSQLNIDNQSVFKIFGDSKKTDFLGVLHINNMIPVPNDEVDIWKPDKIKNEQYKRLIIKQSKKIHENNDIINDQAQLIYDSKTNRLDRDYFKKNRKDVMTYKKITCDLEKLESVFKNESEIRRNNQLKKKNEISLE